MTVRDCISAFLIEQQIRGNAKNTVLYYSRCLGFFADFDGNADKPINSISELDCKRYYLYLSKKEVTSTTIQTYIRALRAFLSWCYA